MNHEFNQSGDAGVLFLRGSLTIEDASELKDVLARALANVTALEVDMAGVDSADLACLQVFCSAHRTALLRGSSLWLRDMGRDFLGLLATGGFLRHIGCGPERDDCLWMEEKE
jgi:anti-anti-sigma regulatory factor